MYLLVSQVASLHSALGLFSPKPDFFACERNWNKLITCFFLLRSYVVCSDIFLSLICLTIKKHFLLFRLKAAIVSAFRFLETIFNDRLLSCPTGLPVFCLFLYTNEWLFILQLWFSVSTFPLAWTRVDRSRNVWIKNFCFSVWECGLTSASQKKFEYFYNEHTSIFDN